MNIDDKPFVWLYVEIKTPPFLKTARLEAGFLLRKLQLDPTDVGFFSTNAIMFCTNSNPHLVQQPWLVGSWSIFGEHRHEAFSIN